MPLAGLLPEITQMRFDGVVGDPHHCGRFANAARFDDGKQNPQLMMCGLKGFGVQLSPPRQNFNVNNGHFCDRIDKVAALGTQLSSTRHQDTKGKTATSYLLNNSG